MGDEVKMVPALCTQCGGKLTVDPIQETAECPFCGASFAVEKAISNYNVQNATFEHVDNVNIDMSGTVHTVLDFVGKQMSESREMRKELRKQQKEDEKEYFNRFVKIGIPFFIIFFIFAGIMVVVLNRIDGGEASTSDTEEASTVNYDVERGRFYIDIPNPAGYIWEFDEFHSSGVNLDSTKEKNGLHYEVSADQSFGMGYAVLHWQDEDDPEREGYMIYELDIEDNEISYVITTTEVSDMSEFHF